MEQEEKKEGMVRGLGHTDYKQDIYIIYRERDT